MIITNILRINKCYWLSFTFLLLIFLFWKIQGIGKGVLRPLTVLGLKARGSLLFTILLLFSYEEDKEILLKQLRHGRVWKDEK